MHSRSCSLARASVRGSGRASIRNALKPRLTGRAPTPLDMQARSAYSAGMKQYTLRNVPADVDRALRRTAREQGKSLNQVAIETLGRAVGVAEPRKRRDLSDLVGTWLDDPETAAALEDQRRIDPESWR